MRPPQALMEFLRAWEGLPGGRPALSAYRDAVGVLTIGFGHTNGVTDGQTITPEEADALLVDDVDEAWHGIDPFIKQTLAEHEMSAITSLCMNVGVAAISQSTLLSRLNNGDFGSAADQFLRWCKGGRPLRTIPGLAKRRAAERAMFLDAEYRGRP